MKKMQETQERKKLLDTGRSISDYDGVSLCSGGVVTGDFPFPDSPAPLPFSGVLTIKPYYVHVGEVSPHESQDIPKDIQILWATQLANANDVFKQIGIQIKSGDTFRIPEIQVDDIDSGVFDNKKKNAHLKIYKAAVEQTKGGGESSDIEIAPVFMVKSFCEFGQNGPETTGQTVTTWLADHLLAEGRPVFDTDQSGCFIAYGLTINEDTLAHELGHLLLDDRFFYNSASDKDGTRHHLSARDHLMSTKYRTASIIDFEPVVKDVYADPRFPNQEEYDSIENIRSSRINHILVYCARPSAVFNRPHNILVYLCIVSS